MVGVLLALIQRKVVLFSLSSVFKLYDYFRNSESSKTPLKSTSVPVPIYCRPLGGEDIGMKIWCATAVDLSGGEAGFPTSNGMKFLF